jgi:uncharacterized membrane protein
MNATFTPAIWIHLAAALAALVLGAGIFLAKKGTFFHRIAGRSWALLMLVTIVSTIWIKGNGNYSWIHLLSIGTFFGLAAAVTFAVTGRIRAHRKTIIGLYVGALVVAGAFTLVPSRLLGRALWTQLGLI